MRLKKVGLIIAPLTYWRSTKAEKRIVCNGCGPKGWKGKIVPDTMWGLSVTPACNAHDWMYEEGGTGVQKAMADEVFLDNMLSLIDEHTNWKFIGWLRSKRARKYYRVVKKVGKAYFKYKYPLV